MCYMDVGESPFSILCKHSSQHVDLYIFLICTCYTNTQCHMQCTFSMSHIALPYLSFFAYASYRSMYVAQLIAIIDKSEKRVLFGHRLLIYFSFERFP